MAKRHLMKKYSDENPDVRAIRKYEREIEALQKKYDEANDAHDWSTRNWCYNQITAKRTNMQLLLDKLKRRSPNAVN